MEQYRLDGELVEDTSTSEPATPAAPTRPPVQLDLGVRNLVPNVTRSARWHGPVTAETLDMQLAKEN